MNTRESIVDLKSILGCGKMREEGEREQVAERLARATAGVNYSRLTNLTTMSRLSPVISLDSLDKLTY